VRRQDPPLMNIAYSLITCVTQCPVTPYANTLYPGPMHVNRRAEARSGNAGSTHPCLCGVKAMPQHSAAQAHRQHKAPTRHHLFITSSLHQHNGKLGRQPQPPLHERLLRLQ
jgi:hypothetical protein